MPFTSGNGISGNGYIREYVSQGMGISGMATSGNGYLREWVPQEWYFRKWVTQRMGGAIARSNNGTKRSLM